jgi:hypothetical protein
MPVPYYGDFLEDDTINIPFNTFTSDDPSASVTVTDLVDTDVYIFKDGSTTEYGADAAVTFTKDFDGNTGAHMCTIDLSENAYFATGSEYAVMLIGITVDGATLNVWIGAFSIERAGGALATAKSILDDTDDIGVAGAGLTGIPGGAGVS